jgi:prenyltransferase beta subunit
MCSWGPGRGPVLGLTPFSAHAGQASAAAATAELLKKQEELNRKAEELDRRERELQHVALGGTASKWALDRMRKKEHLIVWKEQKKCLKSLGSAVKLLNCRDTPY